MHPIHGLLVDVLTQLQRKTTSSLSPFGRASPKGPHMQHQRLPGPSQLWHQACKPFELIVARLSTCFMRTLEMLNWTKRFYHSQILLLHVPLQLLRDSIEPLLMAIPISSLVTLICRTVGGFLLTQFSPRSARSAHHLMALSPLDSQSATRCTRPATAAAFRDSVVANAELQRTARVFECS